MDTRETETEKKGKCTRFHERIAWEKDQAVYSERTTVTSVVRPLR